MIIYAADDRDVEWEGMNRGFWKFEAYWRGVLAHFLSMLNSISG